MIKKLIIDNFQSHLHTELEFSEGINVISGSSNNGKTAIMRALNWAIVNRPQGLSFKSTFSNKTDPCKVILEINDHVIIREKSNAVNSYHLNETSFNTIGNDIPSEISTAINISDLNLASQFDKHFLLMDSPGEVGRTINKIVKLDDIDGIISALTSKISSTNKELELKKKDLDQYYVDLKKFENFDRIERLIMDLIALDSALKSGEERLQKLSYLITELQKAEETISNLEGRSIEIEDRSKEFEADWIKYNTNLNLFRDLSEIIDALKTIEVTIQKLESPFVYEKLYKDTEEKLINYISKISIRDRLQDIVMKWDGNRKEIKSKENDVEKYSKDFKDLLTNIGVCPLCERAI